MVAGRALALLVLAACGSRPAPGPVTAAEPAAVKATRPASFVAHVAALPDVIDGLSYHRYADFDIGDPIDVFRVAAGGLPCWTQLAAAFDSYYWLYYTGGDGKGFVSALHGSVQLDDIARCLDTVGGHVRLPEKHPRLVAYDASASIADLAGHWLAYDSLGQDFPVHVLRPATSPNPLAALLALPRHDGPWMAIARDYTSNLFEVASRGALFEYDAMHAAGPMKITLVFGSEADARLALARFERPHAALASSAFGVGMPALLAEATKRGTLRVEGATVVFEGQVAREDWFESPFELLRQMSIPVGKPRGPDDIDLRLGEP